MKKNILDYTLPKLSEELVSLGHKKFRATQIYTWVFEKQIYDFTKMSDIAKSGQEQLSDLFEVSLPTIHSRQDSEDGTIKLLVRLNDGSLVETVLMRYNYGNTVCVTSQVGCNMGCKFCASGLLKKKRNLTTGEMVGQVMIINNLLMEKNERVSHVVIMGIGEPFDNYDNMIDFVRVINDPKALAIGARHITVSTCGLVERIKQLANEGIQIRLAVSLHAPTDEKRSQIMPINRSIPLAKLMEAVKYYEEVTNKRITFEYILLKDFNDTLEDAKNLVALVKDSLAFVNLIPYNPVDEHGFGRSTRQRQKEFMDYLMKNGVTTTIRKEFGSDIDAACGQLRAKKSNEEGV